MAKNLANLLTDIVKRAKLNTDDRKTIKAALENSALSSIEIDESDYDSMLESLHNIDTAKNILEPQITQRVKTETLNGFDAQILEILGEGLDDSELQELKNEAKTPSKLRKAFEAQRKKIIAQFKKDVKDGDPNAAEALRNEISKLNDLAKKQKEEYEAQLAKQALESKRELFNERIGNKLISRQDIADNFKTSKYFAENVMKELDLFLEKNSIEIDYKTNALLNKETKTPYHNKQHEPVDIDWAIGSVIKGSEWEKKSNVPEPVEVVIDQNPKDTRKGVFDRIKAKNGS
jgi:hypothetical protein